MGWLMCRKHPDVTRKGKTIDLADLKADPVIMFQHRHYYFLVTVFGFMFPSLAPWYFWNEDMWLSFVMAMSRYVTILHVTWLVNSAAHLWGHRPYDASISPAENMFVAFVRGGEGFHNYHHTFPQDYSTSEWRYSLNWTTLFIDCMALVGQAYDRKTISKETVRKRMLRTGEKF